MTPAVYECCNKRMSSRPNEDGGTDYSCENCGKEFSSDE